METIQGIANHMAKVEIYTKAFCGYCHRAKRLLEGKGVEFSEYDITMGGAKRTEMMQRKPERRTKTGARRFSRF